MRVALVMAGSVPNPAQSGTALVTWTVTRHLLSAGHEVAVVVLHDEDFHDPGSGMEGRVAALRALGADVRPVRSRASTLFGEMTTDVRSRVRRLLRPTEEELFPYLLDGRQVAELLDDLEPDSVLAYHWEGVAATRSVRRRFPRLGAVIDLPHLVARYRWRAQPSLLGLARLQARLRTQPHLEGRLLNECEAAADFAAHHADWLRSHGVAHCDYLRTPVDDLGGPDWQAERERNRSEHASRVLLIGHLRGISTLEGLDLFAERVLPRVESALGREGLEVRVVGAYEPPRRLREALDRPSVRLLGYLPDIDTEFRSADVVVVPTPIPLGTRVRVLTAFTYGCPVVAHETTRLGIPELEHGRNVMLGRTGDELADGVLKVIGDDALRVRLETGGRETYERYFSPAVAGGRITEILETLARS